MWSEMVQRGAWHKITKTTPCKVERAPAAVSRRLCPAARDGPSSRPNPIASGSNQSRWLRRLANGRLISLSTLPIFLTNSQARPYRSAT